VAAVLDEDSECARVLLRSGVEREAVLRQSESREGERPAPTSEPPTGSSLPVSRGAREFLARAAGVAAAFGDAPVGSEHLIVSLIWTEVRSRVQRLLQEVPGGRPQLAKELRAAGIHVPDTEPPAWPKWGERMELTPEEAEVRMQSLRAEGQQFLFNWRDGKAVLVVAEGYERR
jgi:hypothetical protein